MGRDHVKMEHDSSDQAEYWYQRMHAADCTSAERAEFERWRARHPQHAAAYRHTEHLYHRAADLRLDPHWQAVGKATRRRVARAARVRRAVRWSVPVAAVLVLALGAGWQFWDPVEPELHYATTVGERRTLDLNDGTSVVLDTDSKLAIRFSRKQRNLVLEHGQAQFSVASQPQRPFVVRAGEGAVRAVGTQFQVRKRDAGVWVTLLEGVVTVSAPDAASGGTDRGVTLAAGEQVSFGNGQPLNRQPADLAVAEGWIRGEQIFDRRPLREVIEEMNRYTQVKLRLADPSLNELEVSGAFYDNDQDSMIRALELGWSLRAERTSDTTIVLHPRR